MIFVAFLRALPSKKKVLMNKDCVEISLVTSKRRQWRQKISYQEFIIKFPVEAAKNIFIYISLKVKIILQKAKHLK